MSYNCFCLWTMNSLKLLYRKNFSYSEAVVLIASMPNVTFYYFLDTKGVSFLSFFFSSFMNSLQICIAYIDFGWILQTINLHR